MARAGNHIAIGRRLSAGMDGTDSWSHRQVRRPDSRLHFRRRQREAFQRLSGTRRLATCGAFDELLYLPRNVRAHKLCGFSPVEQIALTVNIALRRDMATLDYYRSGSTPDAFATLPKEWTVDQIRQFQDYFDALMSGNAARRRMTKFMPADFRLIEARQPPLKDQYDEWLARVICYAFLSPRLRLRQPGQSRHIRDAAHAGDAGRTGAAECPDQERARRRAAAAGIDLRHAPVEQIANISLPPYAVRGIMLNNGGMAPRAARLRRFRGPTIPTLLRQYAPNAAPSPFPPPCMEPATHVDA